MGTQIQKLDDGWRGTVNAYVRCLWGGPLIVSLGQPYDSSALPGFVAVEDDALLGVALYRMVDDSCEVSVLLTLVQGMGVGTKLLDTVKQAARENSAHRLWLVTTNDNTQAIRFYQKYGFRLDAVHMGAFEAVMKLKGELSALGNDGILIEHEFEFGMIL